MKSKYKGVLFVLLSAVCFSAMSTCVKLSGDLPAMEKSFFRNVIALVVATGILIRSRNGLRIQPGNFKFLMVRALCGTCALICNFYAIDQLPLSDANILNKMSPFFTIIFSFLIVKEKLKPFQVGIVAAAFFGSLFVIKPTFDSVVLGPSIIGLLGGITAGLAYSIVRLLGIRNQNKVSIVFLFSLVSTVITLPLMISVFEPMTKMQLLFLIFAGMFSAGGQFSITAAYGYAPAKEISVYEYTQIIFSTIMGVFLFSQMPDIWSFVGYGIICGMAILMFVYNNRSKKMFVTIP